MVIQRRVANGNVNFTRDWNDYVNGFGDLNGEFWYGLDNIHYLTTRDDVELRIDMVIEDDGSELTWTYQNFTVAGADDKYTLTIGGGVGTGRDAMNTHNGQQFSTYDNDNDQLRVIVHIHIKEDGGTIAVMLLISMVHMIYHLILV